MPTSWNLPKGQAAMDQNARPASVTGPYIEYQRLPSPMEELNYASTMDMGRNLAIWKVGLPHRWAPGPLHSRAGALVWGTSCLFGGRFLLYRSLLERGLTTRRLGPLRGWVPGPLHSWAKVPAESGSLPLGRQCLWGITWGLWGTVPELGYWTMHHIGGLAARGQDDQKPKTLFYPGFVTRTGATSIFRQGCISYGHVARPSGGSVCSPNVADGLL